MTTLWRFLFRNWYDNVSVFSAKQVQEFATANTYSDTVLWVFKTDCCCTNSIYNNQWQIYTGGAGEGGGFQRSSESMLQNSPVNVREMFKYKAASSLAAYATWTNQFVPSSLTLWISAVWGKDRTWNMYMHTIRAVSPAHSIVLDVQ